MKKRIGVWGIILLLLLTGLNIAQTLRNNSQAMPAFVLDVSFTGDYKNDDGEWKPIVRGEHIPMNDGEVVLRGTLQKTFPDGEIVEPVKQGELVSMFFNHAYAEVHADGETIYVFDSENPQIGNSTCGKYWSVYEFTQVENEVIEIHLKSPHAIGKQLIVDEFLESMHMYAGGDGGFTISKKMANLRTMGFVILFTAIFLFGSAMFFSLLHMKQSKIIWGVGATVFCAGCYYYANSMNDDIWNENITLSTAMYVLSIMLYVFFLQFLIVQCFVKPLEKAGNVLVAISGTTTGVLIACATIWDLKLYDMLSVWTVVQSLISILLLIYCCKNLKYVKGQIKAVVIVFIIAIICLVLDIASAWNGWWKDAFCSASIFAIMYLVALFVVLRMFPKSIQANFREKEMQAELEKKKTEIMLSQIQPHFLYNSLGAIRELCRQDPEDARQALSTFITYLRGNMDSIRREYAVHFSKELKHISAYLELEKLRFGDDLNVVYDIQETEFSIPSLTVQPLVENAVKHGICGREEGGTVTLHTHREGDAVIITIQDDGVGFNVENLDEIEHVGLENVRKRLQYTVNGELTIDSKKDVGTTVTIRINDRKDLDR